METVKVSTVSEGIAALQRIHAQHGNLQMLDELGGPYQLTTTIWNKEDRLVAGADSVELPDGVTIEGVGVVKEGTAVIPKIDEDVILKLGKLKCYLDRYEFIMMNESLPLLLWQAPVPPGQPDMLVSGYHGLDPEAWTFQSWLLIDIREILEDVGRALNG